MHQRRNQLTITAVAFILGLLVVVQLRAQSGGSGLAALSAQDLTVLVANLNERNDQLRREVASLEVNLATLARNQDRGKASIDEIGNDLRRIRAYAGLDPVVGPGVSVLVAGPIDGPGIEDLVNELRNAGAEAIAVDRVRVVPGTLILGSPGEVSVDGESLSEVFELSAIGSSEQLTGSLLRSGGVIAQLAATQPDALLTVTPMDRIELPATLRTLVPTAGRPSL